jgi:hypothetical protein
MDIVAGQLVIISRAANGDEEGWMQILVFIVLAVFWAIGGIMKARAAKTQQEKQKQQPKERPQPRPRPSLERFLQREPEKARARPMQARAAKIARQLVRDKAAEQAKKEPVAVQSSESVKDVLAEVDKIDYIGEIAPVEAAMAAVARQEIELGTSEQLREAMLHFEIFGKCIGLREEQEHVWMR